MSNLKYYCLIGASLLFMLTTVGVSMAFLSFKIAFLLSIFN